MLGVLLNNRIAHRRNRCRAYEPKVVCREDLPGGHRPQITALTKQQFGNVSQSPPDWP
jgi:hypothetical protein